MEKSLASAIATLLSVLLLFVYVLPYYAPATLAQPIGNGSTIINGSISGIPSGVTVTLFIVDSSGNMVTTPIVGITSSQNTFSTPAMPPINANDGDIIGFRLNGKDTGTTIVFHPGTTMTVHLTYTPPGSGYTLTNPATPVPFKINSSVTPTATTDTTLPPSVTPAPISNTPTVTAASPSPTATFPVNTVIIVVLVGIVLLALAIFFLRKR